MKNRTSSHVFVSLIADELLENGGVSADIKNKVLLLPKNSWFFPKYSSKTRIIPEKIDLIKEIESFISDYKQLLLEKDTNLGIWLNPNTKHYYLDVTTSIKNLDLAKKTAKKISRKEGRKIVTLYNPKLKKIEYLWKDVKS